MLISVVELREGLNRGKERCQVQQEGGEFTNLEVTINHPSATYEQHQCLAENGDPFGAGCVDRSRPNGIEIGILVVTDHIGVVDDIVAAAVVSRDDPNTGQALLQVGQDAANVVADLGVCSVGPTSEPVTEHDGDGNDHK